MSEELYHGEYPVDMTPAEVRDACERLEAQAKATEEAMQRIAQAMTSTQDEREYRKTATIRAVQWWKDGDHPAVVRKSARNRYADEGVPWIETLEGGHVVTPGDWIATGVKGEHWPIKPDVFAATYEPVSSLPAPDTAGEVVGSPAANGDYRDQFKPYYAPQPTATGGDAERLITLIEQAHDDGESIEGMLVRDEFREWCISALQDDVRDGRGV